jgi:hypothetical protein
MMDALLDAAEMATFELRKVAIEALTNLINYSTCLQYENGVPSNV